MKTVALRFSDKFAPDEGTIIAHENIIKGLGYVWYGKLGLPLSQKAIDYVKGNEDLKVLLIHSGKTMRYWAHVVEVLKGEPDIDGIPSYYRDNRDRFKTWFKVIKRVCQRKSRDMPVKGSPVMRSCRFMTCFSQRICRRAI